MHTNLKIRALALFVLSTNACSTTRMMTRDEYVQALQGQAVSGETVEGNDEVTLVVHDDDVSAAHKEFCLSSDHNVIYSDCPATRSSARTLVRDVQRVEVQRHHRVATAVVITALAVLGAGALYLMLRPIGGLAKDR